MVQFLSKGGYILVPIFLGSLIGLAIFFERFWSLRRVRINPVSFFRDLQDLIQKRQWSEARILCQNDQSALAKIMSAVLSQIERKPSRDRLKEIAEEVGEREAFFLERGIGSLGVVASLEPLLGLLGTVWGMIKAFRRVEVGGVGDPRLVAGGVWAALITTAAGLSVAIPAYIGYRFLLAKVDRSILELQSDVSALVDLLDVENHHLRSSQEPLTPSIQQEERGSDDLTAQSTKPTNQSSS